MSKARDELVHTVLILHLKSHDNHMIIAYLKITKSQLREGGRKGEREREREKGGEREREREREGGRKRERGTWKSVFSSAWSLMSAATCWEPSSVVM